MSHKKAFEAIFMAQITEGIMSVLDDKNNTLESKMTFIYNAIYPYLKLMRVLCGNHVLSDADDFGYSVCQPFGVVIGKMMLNDQLNFITNPLLMNAIITKIAYDHYFDLDDNEDEQAALLTVIEGLLS
jgi:hypothetical protein